jgi:hypothetical protein
MVHAKTLLSVYQCYYMAMYCTRDVLFEMHSYALRPSGNADSYSDSMSS